MKTNNIIDESTFNLIDIIREDLIKNNIKCDEKFSQFLVHVAMMINRSKKSECVNDMHLNVYLELKDSAHFEEAQKIAEQIIEKIDETVCDAESKFLVLHICNLLEDY